MITARDLEYHTPEDAGATWAETYFLPVALPEEHILATVYVVVRPGIGMMVNDVQIYGALSDNRGDQLYYDSQAYLTAPERFSDIRSEGGLRVQAVRPPRDTRIDYIGHSGVEIHVDYNGLMDPFDIHDPDHSPKAVQGRDAQHAGSGLGSAWGGHYDMSCRVTGTLRVGGTTYDIDSVERMDHSWGHRSPLKFNAQNSISGAFGDDLAFHIITLMDLDAPEDADQTLAHGYVLEDGQVYGVADLKMVNRRLGSVVTSIEMRVTDVRGKVFDFFAYLDVGAPWNAYQGVTTYTGLMTWLYQGRRGYGTSMETIGVPALNQRRARRVADPQPSWRTG